MTTQPASPADLLAASSLDWAKTHLLRFGDTDLFPVPFELQAISHHWTKVKSELLKVDLAHYHAHALRRFLIPKPTAGFRVGTQLDPIDSIVYAAVVYEAAEAIEQSRVTAKQKVACSYRVQLDPNGSFFSDDTGWKDFHTRSVQLAESKEFTHVVVADIADFYSQAGHHRIENALEVAQVGEDRAVHVEDLLMKFTAKQSRGLPVGPAGSALLAEACLNDADTWLINRGLTHARYVDDFRIFCKSKEEAVHALHDLTDYLYTAQRLSLQVGKTRIRTLDEFISRELRDPREEEERGKIEKLGEMIARLLYATGIEFEVEQLDKDAVNKRIKGNLQDLFDGALGQKPLHLGLIRYILRRATAMKTAVLIDRVFRNLELLLPVFREVGIYLKAVRKSLKADPHGAMLLALLKSSSYGALPHVRLWGLDIVESNPTLLSSKAWQEVALSSESSLGVRPIAAWAAHHKQLDWIRARKETWANHGPWDRRSIVWSAAALPKDERNAFLDLVADESTDLLDQAVAVTARAVHTL